MIQISKRFRAIVAGRFPSVGKLTGKTHKDQRAHRAKMHGHQGRLDRIPKARAATGQRVTPRPQATAKGLEVGMSNKQSWEAVKAPKGQYSPAYYVEVGDGPDVVCDVYDLEGDGGESVARLIAGAPDMLDELRSILEVLEASGIGPRQETIRQVLAKATL